MRKTYLPLSDEDRDYLKALSKREPFRHKLWTVPESFYIKPME